MNKCRVKIKRDYVRESRGKKETVLRYTYPAYIIYSKVWLTNVCMNALFSVTMRARAIKFGMKLAVIFSQIITCLVFSI